MRLLGFSGRFLYGGIGMQDLTKGSPGSVLIRHTLPLFGSVIFQQLYSIADSFVAGRYIDSNALAAVGNSYEVTLICIALAFGCSMGVSVIAAHLTGEGKQAEARTCISTALLAALGIGLATMAGGWLLGTPLLHLMRTPLDVFPDSLSYLNIYLLGFPFMIVYQVTTGVFSALGDSKTPFWFLAASSVANILMDVWFVRDFGLGVPGVAWATFLCQSVCSLAALAVLLHRLRRMVQGRVPLWSTKLLQRMLRIAVPSTIQQGCISVGNILIQIVINGFGPACMAGYAAAVKLNSMCITSITALGNGVSNFTGQNLGAGRKDRVAPGLRGGVALGAGMGLLFTAVFLLGGEWLVGQFIMDGTAKALEAGVSFLRIVAPFYAMIAIKLTVDGVLRGAAQMQPFMISTMTDLVLRVALAFGLAWLTGVFHGVWWAWPIGWAVGTAMSVLFTIRWMSGSSCLSGK